MATSQTKAQSHCPQETVRLMLRQMDPAAVVNRRQHRLQRRTYTSLGPNHMWHVDGYDKLRPYGILISGSVLHLYKLFFLSNICFRVHVDCRMPMLLFSCTNCYYFSYIYAHLLSCKWYSLVPAAIYTRCRVISRA